jgi:drug/metabolite transporter (DMT)-like permease
MPLKTSPLPYLALFVGILVLSFSGILIHWSTAPGIVTSFYRMAIAAGLLLPVVVLHVRKSGFTLGRRPLLRLLPYPLAGGVLMALDLATWSTSIQYTRIANSTLLNNIAPLWVALFAAFIWRERLSGRFWLGLVLTLAGAGVVLGNDLLNHPQLGIGDGLAIVSSLFWAGYYLATQTGRKFFDALVYIWLVEVGASATLLIICLATGAPLGGFPTTTWFAILGAAIGPQIMGHLLLSFALGHIPASLVSPTMISQPVITALLAIPLAGQALATGQWLGGLTVLIGIYLVNVSRSKPPKAIEPVECEPVQI